MVFNCVHSLVKLEHLRISAACINVANLNHNALEVWILLACGDYEIINVAERNALSAGRSACQTASAPRNRHVLSILQLHLHGGVGDFLQQIARSQNYQ